MKNACFSLSLKCCLLILLFSLPRLGSATPDNLYNKTIFFSPSSSKILQNSVADLKEFLGQATKTAFSVTAPEKGFSRGINLLMNKPGLLTPGLSSRLERGTIEDFVLLGDSLKLLIVATHPVGLSRGIYEYLNLLGFRWYYPGPLWSIIPSLSSIRFKGERFVHPELSLRDFFGTGDIAPLPYKDPEQKVKGEWMDWKRRNRMGGEIVVSGHYGEVFNDKYQSVFAKHPEFLAQINGQRNWNITAQWCISNKELRQLFIADRLAELQNAIRNRLSDSEKMMITVDPADSPSDCECENCKRMGTPSDRVFFLANETAKAFGKVSPQAYVNLFAYSTHAAPPSFPLQSNVVVQLVPYAFQSVGTPEQMIAAWRKVHTNLLMYDYYGLSDWHWDTPLAGPKWGVPSVVSKLNSWKQDGFKGYLLESAFASAVTGLGLYTMARLGWDSKLTAAQIETEFYLKLFGSSTPVVEKFYKKLYSDFQGVMDLPYLFDLLDRAGKQNVTEAQSARIISLKAYLNYLLLYYKHLRQPQNNEAQTNLYEYAIKIYPLMVIHSTHIAELLYRTIPQETDWLKNWRFDNPNGITARINFLGLQEIEKLFQANRQQLPVLSSAGLSVTKKSTIAAGKIELGLSPSDEGMMLLDWPETYVQPSGNKKIFFYLKTNQTSTSNDKQEVAVELIDTSTSATIFSQAVTINTVFKLISIQVPINKVYRLYLKPTNWIRLSVPTGQWLAFKTIPQYAVFGKIFFYNSSNTPYLFYTNTTTEQPNFLNDKRQKASIEKVNELGVYKVNLGSVSGWWSVEGSEYKVLQFHQMPTLFFPHKNYTVTH